MSQVFSLDNPFVRFMSKVADVFVLNLVWLIFSLPIVTMGASTTAACYVGMRLARGDEGYVFKRFWKSFKLNFKQATIIYLIQLVIGAVLAADLYIWVKMPGQVATVMTIVTTVLIVIYASISLYTYGVLARFENTILGTVKNAALLAVANFPFVIIMLAIFAIYVALNFMAAIFTMLTVFIGFGFLFYTYGVLYNISFRKFVPLYDRVENDDEEFIKKMQEEAKAEERAKELEAQKEKAEENAKEQDAQSDNAEEK